MSFHWKVLLWMAAGVLVGFGIQKGLAGQPTSPVSFTALASGEAGVGVASASGKGGLVTGDVVRAVIVDRGGASERRVPLADPADVETVLADARAGDVLWFVRAGSGAAALPVSVTLGLARGSARARAIYPFDYAADIFLFLLKMLIVPLVMASITAGVAGVGSLKDLRRLGGKTFGYYMGTSLLAILVGQTLVNVIRPGKGADLGLSPIDPELLPQGGEAGFAEVIKRMVPENVVEAMSTGNMLQIIFFSLLFGFFITRTPEPHGQRVRELVESFFEVMMRLAEGVLSLLPYGVFALMVRVVAQTGFGVFVPLGLYMMTVALALVLHATVSLPLVLRIFARISPLAWARAMSPALMTAFSTSSSSMTLPVTMNTVEHRGRVSNKVTSFTLPLGATINMDGTALYECIGVIFLAQYYAGAGEFTLTLGDQGLIVLMALMASVGAAGIPSAGLVMMLTILTALGLPVEGAALLLAVDRPLDMMRTVVNVWSDSCGAAVIARSEGEEGPADPILTDRRSAPA